MIRIGDFSKLSRVSVKTLRYYDDMDLIKPVYVDALTGYRFYEYHQLPRLNRILALKDLGFSLEEIGRLLAENPPPDRPVQIMQLRKEEAHKRMLEEAERLERVEARLRLIEQETDMTRYDVVIKRVESVRVASVRGIVPSPPQQAPLWRELWSNLDGSKAKPAGACMTLYYDEEYKEKDWDIEVCQPITGELGETDRVKVRTLPAVESMACTVHHGPFTAIQQAYDAALKWIDEGGYRIVGPAREVVLQAPAEAKGGSDVAADQSDPNGITEIQYPVEKAK